MFRACVSNQCKLYQTDGSPESTKLFGAERKKTDGKAPAPAAKKTAP